MCGIAGFQGQGSLDDARRMIACIAYRGPDLQDATMIDRTGLAHARLSIIDTSHGADQPMRDASGAITITFNGEIYNYRPLRETLMRTGRYSFRTNGDTEVLLYLYLEHGTAMLPMLNGMFVFAIHDARDGSLLLARDRMGKKPLHYVEANGTFVFGSELKALQAHPAVRGELDPVALNQYLSFEYVPTPRSILKGVRKLEPGHHMLVRDGRVVKNMAYWRIDLTKKPIGEAEAAARLDKALHDATERRLMSDVPLGVFLSGGIDSSAVAWYAQQSCRRIDTFSIGFEEASYDESSYARSVAERIGSAHHVEILRQRDSLELIPELYAKLDEPFADASLIPTHLLSRFARRHVTVALGGDGSDELLAGYPTFGADRFRRFFAAMPAPAIRMMKAMAELLPSSDRNISFDFKVKQFLRGFGSGEHHVNTRWLGGFTPEEKHDLLTPDVLAQLHGTHGLEPIDDLLYGSAWAKGDLDEIIFVFLRTYLLDDILFKVDRASMYTSLEVRAPFMDVEVVELINSLPDNLKRRGFNGKYLLKKVMRGKLPDAVIDRPKKGFGIPLSDWLRKELRPLCEELLATDVLKRDGLFQPAFVERLKQEHFSKRANHRKLLWTLMVFQMWRRNVKA